MKKFFMGSMILAAAILTACGNNGSSPAGTLAATANKASDTKALEGRSYAWSQCSHHAGSYLFSVRAGDFLMEETSGYGTTVTTSSFDRTTKAIIRNVLHKDDSSKSTHELFLHPDEGGNMEDYTAALMPFLQVAEGILRGTPCGNNPEPEFAVVRDFLESAKTGS